MGRHDQHRHSHRSSTRRDRHHHGDHHGLHRSASGRSRSSDARPRRDHHRPANVLVRDDFVPQIRSGSLGRHSSRRRDRSNDRDHRDRRRDDDRDGRLNHSFSSDSVDKNYNNVKDSRSNNTSSRRSRSRDRTDGRDVEKRNTIKKASRSTDDSKISPRYDDDRYDRDHDRYDRDRRRDRDMDNRKQHDYDRKQQEYERELEYRPEKYIEPFEKPIDTELASWGRSDASQKPIVFIPRTGSHNPRYRVGLALWCGILQVVLFLCFVVLGVIAVFFYGGILAAVPFSAAGASIVVAIFGIHSSRRQGRKTMMLTKGFSILSMITLVTVCVILCYMCGAYIGDPAFKYAAGRIEISYISCVSLGVAAIALLACIVQVVISCQVTCCAPESRTSVAYKR